MPGKISLLEKMITNKNTKKNIAATIFSIFLGFPLGCDKGGTEPCYMDPDNHRNDCYTQFYDGREPESRCVGPLYESWSVCKCEKPEGASDNECICGCTDRTPSCCDKISCGSNYECVNTGVDSCTCSYNPPPHEPGGGR